MASAARTRRKRPGLTRRMVRSTLRVGMLATAVLVGRKTAGGGRPGTARAEAAAGRRPPAGRARPRAAALGPSTRPTRRPSPTAATAARPTSPSRSPPRGWLDIAKRTAREVKADQVPLLGAGVAFYALLSLFPAIIAGVSIYGLVADPQTVRDQIAKLAEMLSPETAKILGQQIQQVTSGAGGALPRRNARC